DGFHLDLCGTFDGDMVRDFSPIVPLVQKGRGRCLAITVADARRNKALEQWPEVRRHGRRYFGKSANALYERITEQQQRLPVNKNLPAFMQQFDPEKAAKREFALLVAVTELLKKATATFPTEVERYIYVSRYGKTPFRMRTYFFHF